MPEAADDPYLYPGTATLRNLKGLQDPIKLHDFEGNRTICRIGELEYASPKGSFDAAHLRAIHRHIFQDVYAWAGEVRTVDMGKSGQVVFARPSLIMAALNDSLSKLKQERFLQGLPTARFAERAGDYLGDLNAIHPFREGNGRTQREFVRQLAQKAGHTINWNRIEPGHVHEASRQSFYGDNRGLVQLINEAIEGAPNKNLEHVREALKQFKKAPQPGPHERDGHER